jgi:gliding motility-associated-like protein
LSNLNLTIIIPFIDTINAEIYRGDTVTENGFNASESGTFTQVYQNINGCDSIYILNLNVINLMFPNVVTPNDDGINDIFEIHDLLNETFFYENELTIYSRYGKQVYHKKNIKAKEDFWSPQVTNSPSGSYFYRFTAKGKTKNINFNGNVEVIR